MISGAVNAARDSVVPRERFVAVVVRWVVLVRVPDVLRGVDVARALVVWPVVRGIDVVRALVVPLR